MNTLSDFEITKIWPPHNPDAIQLYSLATPNGVKASIMLEETGLAYDAHRISFADNDQFRPEFLAISPNNKIPAMIDPGGPGGKPLALFESAAMLIYLAEKTGQLLPSDPAARYETLAWLSFQIGSVGPMFGQLGFFSVFGGKDMSDPLPRKRYTDEAIRILGVLDKRLAGREWVMGDYTIADIAIAPWLRTLVGFYDAGEAVGFARFTNVSAYLDRFLARPAVQRGLDQPPSPS